MHLNGFLSYYESTDFLFPDVWKVQQVSQLRCGQLPNPYVVTVCRVQVDQQTIRVLRQLKGTLGS